MEFRTVDVSSWAVDDEEWQGEQSKYWLRELESAPRARRWLFKPSRAGSLPRKHRAGVAHFRWHDAESELIASELAKRIGVPAAAVALARRDEERGCISRDIRAPHEAMHSGDAYLSGLRLPGYVPNRERARNRTGHHLEAIERVLESLQGPAQTDPWDARAVFAGYLVLDAWIANTDRHSENWALTDDGSTRRLATSFDHGSSLAAGLDERMIEKMDPLKYAKRGMAQKFDGGRGETLVELARRASRRWGGPWLDRLAHVGRDDESSIVERVPGMSDARRTFIVHLLAENRRRLLEP